MTHDDRERHPVTKSELDEVALELSRFSIVLISLGVRETTEYASHFGSGTLVSFGDIRAILTAGHVLGKLPETGEVGIGRVIPRRKAAKPQNLKLDLSHTMRIVEWSGDWESTAGPDIGLLRLPSHVASEIALTNQFYNLAKSKRASFIDGRSFEALTGGVWEWNSELPQSRPNTKTLGFNVLHAIGETFAEPTRKRFDYFMFRPDPDQDVPPPGSYEGVSGGTVWRVTLSRDANGRIQHERALTGVPFAQTDRLDEKRELRCHGPASIAKMKRRLVAEWA